MSRPRRIDPEAFAATISPDVPEAEWRRQLAEAIRMAVVASLGTVQICRPCEGCGRVMRLGGRRWDRGSDGTLVKRFCGQACLMRRKRELLAKRAHNANKPLK